MRWAMMMVMVAGCAGQSASEDLTDLRGRATDCGTITDACDNGMPTPPIVACMNDALQAGVLARAHWGDYDTKMYEWTYDVFADAGKVRVFHTAPDDFGGDPTITEEASCAGPFAVSAMMICGSHPLIDATGCSFPSH
ncbi:MAG: hypothetical protein ABJE66_06735 [Deltaproteobacteria bacterium]